MKMAKWGMRSSRSRIAAAGHGGRAERRGEAAVTVRGPDGDVTRGGLQVLGHDVVQPLRGDLPSGAYSVGWRISSFLGSDPGRQLVPGREPQARPTPTKTTAKPSPTPTPTKAPKPTPTVTRTPRATPTRGPTPEGRVPRGGRAGALIALS
jgi:hypothetical protein